MSVPLIARANEHTYRLRGVTIYVFGPQVAFLTNSDDPEETFLTATLQTGPYAAQLYNWALERLDGDGSFRPVQSALVSPAGVSFSIFNGTTSTISYQFQTDGVIVVVGAGALRVVATVNEIDATCTPLGAGCGEGNWCPPSGLTGAPLACIAAGSVALGGPCNSPQDCVANSSCFDLGAGEGAVCTELCGPGAFDSACGSTGICRQAAGDHGVCRP